MLFVEQPLARQGLLNRATIIQPISQDYFVIWCGAVLVLMSSMRVLENTIDAKKNFFYIKRLRKILNKIQEKFCQNDSVLSIVVTFNSCCDITGSREIKENMGNYLCKKHINNTFK